RGEPLWAQRGCNIFTAKRFGKRPSEKLKTTGFQLPLLRSRGGGLGRGWRFTETLCRRLVMFPKPQTPPP
ncbi:hypothetical protein ACTHUD_15525, partial [Neisseria sp. P0016.S002]